MWSGLLRGRPGLLVYGRAVGSLTLQHQESKKSLQNGTCEKKACDCGRTPQGIPHPCHLHFLPQRGLLAVPPAQPGLSEVLGQREVEGITGARPGGWKLAPRQFPPWTSPPLPTSSACLCPFLPSLSPAINRAGVGKGKDDEDHNLAQPSLPCPAGGDGYVASVSTRPRFWLLLVRRAGDDEAASGPGASSFSSLCPGGAGGQSWP